MGHISLYRREKSFYRHEWFFAQMGRGTTMLYAPASGGIPLFPVCL